MQINNLSHATKQLINVIPIYVYTMIQTRMSIAPIMMPILVTFFYMIILLRVEGVRNENNEGRTVCDT